VVNQQVGEQNVNVVGEWKGTKRKIEQQKRKGDSEKEMRRGTN